MSRRGFGLIDLMVALAIISLGIGAVLGPIGGYRRATERAAAIEGLAWVLDQEMERFRACRTAGCVRVLTTTATTAMRSPEGASWARARISRATRAGPDGTVEVTIRASVPGVAPEASVTSLIWVDR